MKIKEIESNVQDIIGKMSVEPNNLIQGIVGLLEVMHAHNLDKEAVEVLKTCGITLELEGVE